MEDTTIAKSNNKYLLPRLVDAIDNICANLIIELSTSNIVILKLESLNKNNI